MSRPISTAEKGEAHERRPWSRLPLKTIAASSSRSAFVLIRRLIAATLLVVSLGSLCAQAKTLTPSDRVSSAVIVRAGPSTATAIVARLRPGDTAAMVGEVSGWYEVELQSGARGYVSKVWTVVVETSEALTGQTYQVHVIDVGTGLAVFAEGPGFALLYDAGSQDDLHDGDENRVVAYIKAVRPNLQRLDHLILSHPHKDHLQLMPDVFRQFQIGHVWDSGRVNRTDGYCHFLKAAMAEPGALYHDVIGSSSTRTVTFSGSGCNGSIEVREAAMIDAAPVALGARASMSFLYRDARNHPDPNENTLVVRLDLGPRRILLAGDAEGGERKPPADPPDASSIEGQLIACCRADLRADALVVGHHGSLTSSRKAFLDAVGARVYAISSGPYPYRSVRLPDDAIVSELAARGEVLRTDRDDLYRVSDEARSCELNPRRACAQALVDLLPDHGAIIAYNAPFERGCILDLAAACPDLAAALRTMAARLVDLLPVTRNHYYHRDQRGSWSIKAVLPTVAPELSYQDLSVKDGMAAQAAYLEAVDPACDPLRRAEIDVALRLYCGRDTEAMIVLARQLAAVEK